WVSDETVNVAGVPVPVAVVRVTSVEPEGNDIVTGSEVAPTCSTAVVVNTTFGVFGSPAISNNVPSGIAALSGVTDSVVGDVVPATTAALVVCVEATGLPAPVGVA